MTIDERSEQVSSLLNDLPAIFQADETTGGEPNFLGRFLLAFERILLGLGEINDAEGIPAGLEEIIGGGEITSLTEPMRLAGLHRYFEPGIGLDDQGQIVPLSDYEQTPTEFLSWLAGWVALTLRDDWADSGKRELIARAVQLYFRRGTKRGLEEALRIYVRIHTGLETQPEVEVNELNTAFQLGVHSTIGQDTILDGGSPFFFWVRFALPTFTVTSLRQHCEIVTAIVDLQKPAHTDYRLVIETPTFQVGVHSTVGVDTLLGDRNEFECEKIT